MEMAKTIACRAGCLQQTQWDSGRKHLADHEQAIINQQRKRPSHKVSISSYYYSLPAFLHVFQVIIPLQVNFVSE